MPNSSTRILVLLRSARTDPQLKRASAEAQAYLEQNPPDPKFENALSQVLTLLAAQRVATK